MVAPLTKSRRQTPRQAQSKSAELWIRTKGIRCNWFWRRVLFKLIEFVALQSRYDRQEILMYREAVRHRCTSAHASRIQVRAPSNRPCRSRQFSHFWRDVVQNIRRNSKYKMSLDNSKRGLILVTGSTGYLGGRLVPRLLDMGYRVRCLVRDPVRLQGRPWESAVEIVAGDVLQPESLAPAMQGIRAAYYLVHSLGGGAGFHQRDLRAASHFGDAARAAGIERIIYLGGLAEALPGLSEHLRSRQQTGDSLRSAGVPVTEFRAGVIVGSGSVLI